ncbi:Serine/threonine-protein kinase [Bonamia ostreae]|uniref:Serine/threonine-protein kinase n=1 Tax=Bonamia ostreae TaxID=126728 RepID=A0ABV2ARP7_9EUKA
MALGHLHKNGIIYRDLKPENVLFDENGHICLTDFGMSKIFRKGETCAKSICGTAEYLAPEMIEGKEYTHTIDWWTLGVLLYELMVGKSPFKSVGRNQIERQIIDKKVEFPPKMSKSAVDLITKLLEKDPSKRLGSGPSDCSEIMSHKFFEGVDWYRLLMRKISPPYKPKMGSEKDDTSNFYREFTEESLAESKMSAKGYFAHFANFSFCDVDK